MTIIPNQFGAPKHPSEIQVSPEIMEVSVSEPEQVYQKLGTSNQGLSEAKTARRLKEHGPNVVAQDKRHNRWRLFGRALINPLVILLSILALVSDNKPLAPLQAGALHTSMFASSRGRRRLLSRYFWRSRLRWADSGRLSR